MFSALLTERSYQVQEAGQWKAEASLLLCCPSQLVLDLAGGPWTSAARVGCLQVEDATRRRDTAGGWVSKKMRGFLS